MVCSVHSSRVEYPVLLAKSSHWSYYLPTYLPTYLPSLRRYDAVYLFFSGKMEISTGGDVLSFATH